MKGTVKWFNDRKGYGFILGDDEKEIFVHRNSLAEGIYIKEGDSVQYEVESSDKGPNAINLKKIKNN